ncbi:hypothetical protein HYT57_04105 [Candidatus Woesearchaeota archaeon]|nr:hypothetical protein [Candidatus Woesearchaeota archaeon]
MGELVVLESIIFECATEAGIPVKKLEHDIFNSQEEMIGSKWDAITQIREQELMKLLRAREIYATREDKELHYNGR